MAQVTWLGEDHLHGPDGIGPSATTAFGGIRFPKGQPVEVSDKEIIRRAQGNAFFEVSGLVGRPKQKPE